MVAGPAPVGWRTVPLTTTARQASQFVILRTARFCCAAMPAASRNGSSRRCGRAVCGEKEDYALFCAKRRLLWSNVCRVRTTPSRKAALAIWHSTIRADGTLVEAYLLSRRLHLL